MNNPSDSADAPAPAPQSPPPAQDHAWLQALLFADGSAIIDYGDGILLIDEKHSYE